MSDHPTPRADAIVRYVLGFVFTRGCVVLLRKNRGPAGMAGKLNGIGGHVDDGEDYSAAMLRECAEELDLYCVDWRLFCTMRGAAWECACFEATEDHAQFPACNDVGEEVTIVDVADAITREDAMLNLRWLIPMALERPIVGVIDYQRSSRGDR